MNAYDGNNDDKGFLLQLHMRAEIKAKEYAELLHQQRELEMRIERAKQYLEQLNKFLIAEGQQQVSLKTIVTTKIGVGKPGNRSKAFPIRKVQWEGMSINQIVERILNASQDAQYHPREIASLIYEIKNDSDLLRVMHNMRSTMQRGARDGLWERIGRAKFKAKVIEKQGTLVKA